MKLRLNATLRAALIAAVTAVGFTLTQAQAATLTKVITMSDMLTTATASGGATVSEIWQITGNAVYDFDGTGYLGGINNQTLLEALTSSATNYVTVAAWINPTNHAAGTGGGDGGSIFGYGGQSNGIKVIDKEGSMKATTKGQADFNNSMAAGIDTDTSTWQLVAVTFHTNASDTSKWDLKTMVDETVSNLETNKAAGGAEPNTFAIGSGNSGNERELYQGSIGGLTVFTSDDWVTYSELVAKMDAKPTEKPLSGLEWAGTGTANVWNTEAANKNWRDDTTAVAYTSASTTVAIFRNDTAVKSVQLGADLQAKVVSVEGAYTFDMNGKELSIDRLVLHEDSSALTLTGEGTVNAASIEAAGKTITLGDKAVLQGATTAAGTLAGSGTYVLNGTMTLGVTLQDTWTGTVRVVDYTPNSAQNFDNLTKAASTLELQGFSGWSNTWNGTIAQNIKLTNGSSDYAWANGAFGGSADQTTPLATFTGTWSGDGKFRVVCTTDNRTMNYKYMGDISQWTGEFQKDGKQTTVLTFDDKATEVNAVISKVAEAAKFTVVAATGVTFNASVAGDEMTVNAADKTATLAGGANLGAVSVTAGTLSLASENLVLGNVNVASNATLSAADGSSATAAITFNPNSALRVTGDGLVLNGGSTLTFNLGEGEHVNFSTSIERPKGDIIVATGFASQSDTGITFDGEGIADAAAYLSLSGTLTHYTQLKYKDGTLILAREFDGSYWGKDKGDGIWDLTTANWATSDGETASARFLDGLDAYFTASGAGGTITVTDEVTAMSLNVSGEKEYIFTAGGGELTVTEAVNVDGTATFYIPLSGTELSLNIKEAGTLNIGADSSVKTVTDKGTLTVAGGKKLTASGAVTLGNNAVLGGAGTIEAGSVVLATGGEKNHAELKDGATLKTNSISGTGVLHVVGTSHLVATDNASYSEVEMKETSVLEIAEDKTLTVEKHLALTDNCSVSNKGTLSTSDTGDILVDCSNVQLGKLDIKNWLHVTGNAPTTTAQGGTVEALTLESGSSLTSANNLTVSYLTMSNLGESALTVGENLQLGQTTTTKGKVTVGGGTTIIGAVNLTSLSTGTLDLTETGSLTTTGAVDVNNGAITLGRLSTSEVYLKAGSLTSATTQFEVTLADLEALGLTAGQKLTLADVDAEHGAADNLRINGEVTIQDSRDIIYTISQDTYTCDIILTADNAPSDYVWTNGNTTERWSDNLNWSGELVPDSEAWAQVQQHPMGETYTIQMNEDGEARRFTVAPNASAKLTDVNDLTVYEVLEVNTKGILDISGEVAVTTPRAQIDGTLLVANSGRLLAQEVTVTDNITTMNDAYVQAGVLNINGGILEAADGEVAADSINMTAGLIDVDEAAYVHTDALNGDADSIIYGPGVLNVDGKGGRYLGGYDQARIHVSANGDQTLAAREGLSAEGSGIVRLQYVAPATIDRVSGSGMTLVLNSPSTDCTGAPLTLTNPSAVQNGQIVTGLSAVSSAITLNTAAAPIIIQATSLNLGGSTVIVNQTETDVQKLPISTSGQTEGLVLAYLGAEDSFAAVTLNGNLFNRYYINPRLEAGRILVDLNTTHVLDQIEATTYNGRAGAHMLDDAFRQLDPQMAMPTGDLAAVMNALEEGRIPRADTDRMAAAMAGASYAAMGSAFSKDVERQLRSIRNRTTSMGCAECVVNEDMPYVNAWVNAEGEFRKMNRENTLAGYTLNSWGATLGVDVDFTPRFTAGVAFTYLQGDFTSRSADMGDGDLDRMYVSAFARYNRRAWTHTFVGTFGRADASLDRTVDYGAGRYSTKGDTDGTAFGLMYEAGYTVALSEDASTCLQPVFNVLYRHSCLGGYTETGSDAALKYADAEADVVTFGLGARLQSAVGTSAFNRHTLLETRALLKLDAGDRDVTPQANFAGVGGMQKIKSSEYGAFGVEIGAGVMIPVGEGSSSLFFDVSAEFRSGYSDVNGAAGYRVNF